MNTDCTVKIQGDYQTRYNVFYSSKSYSCSERVEKLQKVARTIWQSFGLYFFQAKCWRTLRKVIVGSIVKEKLVPISIAQVHNVDLKPIDFQHPYVDYPQRNYYDHKCAIRECKGDYLQVAKRIRFISYDMLFEALHGCVEKLKILAPDAKFQVGMLKDKSQTWIAELAEKYFGIRFEAAFGLATDHIANANPTRLTGSSKQLIVFDDISYSGSQIYESVKTLIWSQAYHAFKREPVEVFILIPFMTERAIKQIQSLKERAGQNVTLHVITSNEKIECIDDILGARWGDSAGFDRRQAACLPAWKSPDGASFPPIFLKYCNPDTKVPYKSL